MGWSHRSLTTSVDPSAVTPSPASEAPVARNEAQPSVVPAYTIADSGMPRPTASRLTRPMGEPGSRTTGNFPRSAPVRSIHSDRVVASLQGVVPVAAVEPSAQLAADPVRLVQHVADTGPVLRHQSARQGGGGAAGGAFGRRMLRDRPEERFVVAGLVVHPRRPHWLSEAVHGQHRAGGAIDGEPAHMGQVAR